MIRELDTDMSQISLPLRVTVTMVVVIMKTIMTMRKMKRVIPNQVSLQHHHIFPRSLLHLQLKSIEQFPRTLMKIFHLLRKRRLLRLHLLQPLQPQVLRHQLHQLHQLPQLPQLPQLLALRLLQLSVCQDKPPLQIQPRLQLILQ